MTKKEIAKKYREANKEHIKANHKAWRDANPDKTKKYYNPNTEYQKEYYAANKEKIKLVRELNKPNANKRIKERKATEPLFKLKTNIRSLIRETINSKGYKKKTKSKTILGCTFDKFKEHIESQFEPWMNWDNYGNPKDGIFEKDKTWDIDHIIPISSASTEQDVINLNHYTNLKPLCSYINRFVKRSNF